MAKPFAMRRRKGLLQRVSTMKAPITAKPDQAPVVVRGGVGGLFAFFTHGKSDVGR